MKGQGCTVRKGSAFQYRGAPWVAFLATGVSLFGTSALSFGGLLLDLKPAPVSPIQKEVRWTGAALFADVGSVGNADGLLPIDNQTPGGLRLQTPLNIVGVPGSAHNTSDQSTTFFDATLTLTGWNALGPASSTVVGGITILSQLLGPAQGGLATFKFESTDPGNGKVEILSGYIENAIIVGIQNSDTASIQSTTVHYTGGVMYGYLQQLGLGTNGSLSWSLLDIDNFSLPAAGGPLMSFTADMTGLFNVIPEPGACGLLAIAGLLFARRVRRS